MSDTTPAPAPPQLTRCPAIEDMDDKTFMKHMYKRHHNPKMMGPKFNDSDFIYQEWVVPWRTYHARLHDIALPGQLNHYHAPAVTS